MRKLARFITHVKPRELLICNKKATMVNVHVVLQGAYSLTYENTLRKITVLIFQSDGYKCSLHKELIFNKKHISYVICPGEIGKFTYDKTLIINNRSDHRGFRKFLNKVVNQIFNEENLYHSGDENQISEWRYRVYHMYRRISTIKV